MPTLKIAGPRTKENITTLLDCNVLEAAKQRIRHIIAIYDSVAVCFSGGKDSLTVLHLVKEVYGEMGIARPVDVIFRDEELIPDSVIEFVNGYRQLPWVKMLWFAVPLKSSKYILGKTYDLVQWDPAREHVRKKPEWSIKGDGTIYDQYTMDTFASRGFRGKVCLLTGIRADESLVRLRAIVNKVNDSAVCASSDKRVSLGRPIYDWTEKDVFRFFYERNIRYCQIYDHQVFNEEALRVSTPLHAESAKRMGALRTRDPEFYDRILRVFPEVAVQERYYRDLDLNSQFMEYEAEGYEGVRRFVNDTITDPKQAKLARKRLEAVLVRARRSPDAYPVRHLLRVFATGAYKREILPGVRRPQ